jgi:hypothetical protein
LKLRNWAILSIPLGEQHPVKDEELHVRLVTLRTLGFGSVLVTGTQSFTVNSDRMSNILFKLSKIGVEESVPSTTGLSHVWVKSSMTVIA